VDEMRRSVPAPPLTQEDDALSQPETGLAAAARLIDGARADTNGGDGSEVTAADAALLMTLLKVARFSTGRPARDHLVDGCGSLALAARHAGID